MTYDPLAASSKLRSHEIFSELRAECPVHHHRMPDDELAKQNECFLVASPTDEFWSVTRFDDCVEILRDTESYSNKEGPGPERMAQLSEDGMLLIADGDIHRQQRRIANKAFLPRMVEKRRPTIQATVDDLVDRIAAAGRAEVMTDIALPLTVATITDFFGIGGERPEDVARWGQATMAILGGDPEAVASGTAAINELMVYLMEKIAGRRAALAAGDELPDDVLSALITAEDEGRRFSDQEICLAANQFLSAGFDTTASAIGSAIVLLCTHPEQRAKLEGDWSLLDLAAEECLRYESPLEGTFRTAKCPVKIAGVEIPAGSKIRVVYASANRDDSQFENADEFRIDRPASELRGHIAFGQGPHHCIGAALARAELKAAIATLLKRLPGLELDPDHQPERATPYMTNGYSVVPITWDPAKVLGRTDV